MLVSATEMINKAQNREESTPVVRVVNSLNSTPFGVNYD